MKTVKLTKGQIKKVENWLETMQLKAEYLCPFHDKRYWFCKRICWKLFPRVGSAAARYYYTCPCHSYSYTYVRRVAINLLKSQV